MDTRSQKGHVRDAQNYITSGQSSKGFFNNNIYAFWAKMPQYAEFVSTYAAKVTV